LWDGFWRKDTKDAKTKDKGIYDLIKMTLIELIVYYYYYYYYYIYILIIRKDLIKICYFP
jgi:hypothetical protein